MTPVPGEPPDSGSPRVRLRDLSGRLSAGFDSPTFLEWIGGFRENPGLVTMRAGRNALYRLQGCVEDRALDLGIKSFGREPWIKQAIDRRRGSKAERSWRVAARMAAAGVGTPDPVGFLERWEGLRLAESYYLCAFRDNTPTFKDEMLRLFREKAPCTEFMGLMQTVARDIRRMHDAGVLHNDLGNQNIFVSRLPGGGWGGVEFFDLNRASLVASPSHTARGRDLARIYLAPGLMRVFCEMYWAPAPVPAAFARIEAFTRARYRLHTITRAWRHPFREARIRRARDPSTLYPPEPDMWVWDDRSEQPLDLLESKDRSHPRSLPTARASFRMLPGLREEYNALLAGAFSQPVDMSSRVGVVLSARPESWDTEEAFLRPLGNLPVLLRLSHHNPAAAQFAADLGLRLHSQGHEVSFAFLQDRDAVRSPVLWAAFVDRFMERIAPFAADIEIGHAVNRAQWGVRDPSGYGALAAPFIPWKHRLPALRLCGPACADFGHSATAAALGSLPGSFALDALSHHLYMDEVAPPEAFHGRFDLLRNLALAAAVARRSGRCAGSLVISDANWPLAGTGEWSPVGAPYYPSADARRDDPGVDEDTYADYMIRCLLIALCSGLAGRLYGWRLAARGFGLVDDSIPGAWRARPAHAMLTHFSNLMRGARFIARDEADGPVRFRFAGADGASFALLYAPASASPVPAAWRSGQFFDAFGHSLAQTPSRLTGRVCCVRF